MEKVVNNFQQLFFIFQWGYAHTSSLKIPSSLRFVGLQPTPSVDENIKLTGRIPLTLETLTIVPRELIKCGTASIVN
jgi:hypothetical protein